MGVWSNRVASCFLGRVGVVCGLLVELSTGEGSRVGASSAPSWCLPGVDGASSWSTIWGCLAEAEAEAEAEAGAETVVAAEVVPEAVPETVPEVVPVRPRDGDPKSDESLPLLRRMLYNADGVLIWVGDLPEGE